MARGKNMMTALMVGTATLSMVAAAVAPASAQAASANYQIASQPLGQALMQLSRQANVDIVAPARLTRGRTAGAVAAESVDAALRQMLAGTGLSYKANGRRYVIQAGSGSSAGAMQASPASNDGESKKSSSSGGDSPGAGEAEAAGAAAETEGAEQREILVTGTRIGGRPPVGAPLNVYTRDDIRNSGSSTLEQFARTLTENRSGLDTIASPTSNVVFGSDTTAGNNSFGGSSFDLRGLGAGSTLTLLNGARVAPAGINGSFTDIGMFPVSAIERVEVLTDGASAVYGADAVAGVVNIILRRDFDGAESLVQYGTSTSGGAEDLLASQLVGVSWGSGNLLANYEYQESWGLDASERDYIPAQGGPSNLLPESNRHSLVVAGAQELWGGAELSGQAYGSRRDSLTQSTIRFATSSNVTTASSTVDQVGGALSLAIPIAATWRARATINYAEVDQNVESLRQTVTATSTTNSLSTADATSSTEGLEVFASGPLSVLDGRAIDIAAGLSIRGEAFSARVSTSANPLTPRSSRTVRSAFFESIIPLIARDRASQSPLQLSLAGRYDDYSDFGSAFTGRIGATWRPFADLTLRSSYGNSFKAPLLSQVFQPVTYVAQSVLDANGVGGRTNTLRISGGNTDLEPERSRTLTVGADFRPRWVEGLSARITYFNVNFRDRINIPRDTANNSLTSPLLAPFVNRSPSLAEVQAAFASPGFLLDQTGAGPAGIRAILDVRLTNLASTRQEGLDFNIAFSRPTSVGNLSFSLAGTYLIRNDVQVSFVSPVSSQLNAFGTPLRWRVRGNLAWQSDGWSAGASLNHAGSYTDNLIVPNVPIDSWTTADLRLSYETPERAGEWYSGTTLSLVVNNVTNERPPFVAIPASIRANAIPFDPTNASPVGRYISLAIRKRW